MKLFTLQPQAVLDQLEREGYYRCNPVLSYYMRRKGFTPAYDWLVQQMLDRIGLPPDDVFYPVWAWPDKEDTEWRAMIHAKDLYRKCYCIFFEVPDDQVCLTDWEKWQSVTVGEPIYPPIIEGIQDLKSYDQACTSYATLLRVMHDWQVNEYPYHENWLDVFNIGVDSIVQACLWELRLADVTHIEYYRPTRDSIRKYETPQYRLVQRLMQGIVK